MIEWIFPSICGGCDGPLLPTEREICIRCLLDLPVTNFWHVPQKNEGYNRLAPHVANLQGVISGFWYVQGSPLRRWVHAAKYESRPQLLYGAARYMATLIAQESHVPLSEIQGLLPIPISPVRQRQRGYNQAEWAARGLSEIWGIPLLRGQWQRRPTTKSQLTRNRIERWLELESEFICTGTLPKVVGVVDDVLTTGATLAAATRVLPTTTAIWVFTIGITQRRR
ncbi:MAG: hypothetical protein RMK19_08060 [Bacteroidia bacterium]|nr:hypothetical protein [Bacteroidia bacterium]MDW8015950.1 hypothetical protein [Bacteroidia bacterium]